MEYNASWNYDSKKHKNLKSFCCLNARPIDFAKFGRLYLNQGVWEDKRIIPEEWINKTLESKKERADAMGYPYNFHWRILENKDMFAKGILGQYIYICPAKNTIILRFGNKNGNIDWPDFFQEILPQI